MRRKLFVLFVLMMLFGTACSLPGFGRRVSSDGATPTPSGATEATVETIPVQEDAEVPLAGGGQTIPPTPAIVSLAGGQGEPQSEQPVSDTTSLLAGGPSPEATPTLPAPGGSPAGEAVEVVRQARYHTARYSFEPAAGWQMDELDPDTLLIHQTGDDGPYTGAANVSPYAYLRYTEAISEGTRLVDALADMRQTLAGVQTAEDAAMPIIDGLRGAGQFVEGRNDAVAYRAWLVVFPLQNGALQGVFWGPADTWADIAPQLNAILVSLRFPQL